MGSSAPDPEPAGLVAEAVAELYGAGPQEFTQRRKALADAARAAGDAAAARRITALRKPTRAAWVVNRLARADPAAPARLGALAAALRDAEQARDGPRLRELSAGRGPLIDDLTSAALAAADVADPPAGLREEVSATLTAALADPEVAAAFAAGTLIRAAEWAGFGFGFGVAPPAAPGDSDAGGQARERTRPPAGEASGPAGEREDGCAGEARLPAARAEEARLRRERLAEETAARAAEEAAQAAAQRRKAYEDAERAVASAAAAASDAVAAEDRLEVEVRDLEQRLTRARAELADARLSARRAEAAERKARRTLDHLPRPGEGADS